MYPQQFVQGAAVACALLLAGPGWRVPCEQWTPSKSSLLLMKIIVKRQHRGCRSNKMSQMSQQDRTKPSQSACYS